MLKIQFSPKSFIKFVEARVFVMGRSSYMKHKYFLFRPNGQVTTLTVADT